MKQRPYASNRRLSRLCRLLIFVFTVKLAVLGLMILEPGDSTVSGLTSGGQALSVAQAATNEGMASAPALPPNPVGMQQQGGMPPANNPFPVGDPSANNSAATAPEGPQRALPPINNQGRPDSGLGVTTDISRESLARKQEELARKEQELRILEGEIAAKLEHLQILESRLATMIKDAEDTQNAKFRHLIDVLSNMKARQAAEVLETLDRKIAVNVLAGMRGKQAGEILTYVKPEIAANLTENLARMQLPLE